MFIEKEIKYFKDAVYSDLECNCLNPGNNVINELASEFPDLEESEVIFLKNLYNKIVNYKK
jgi:hypothetical protein